MEVGLFEAKTKLSEICKKVVESGEGIVVTRRGKPFVRIEPAEGEKMQQDTAFVRRQAFEQANGAVTEEFELPELAKQSWHDPLAE